MGEDLRHTVDGEPVEEFFRRHLAGDFLLWSPNIQAEAFLNWIGIWAVRTSRAWHAAAVRDGRLPA